MKQNVLRYIMIITLLSGMIACKKNNVVVDNGSILIPPEAVRFAIMPATSNNTYNFNILELPSPGTSFKIPVGVTTLSATDRKVKFTYSSRTAVQGVQYNAPAELTIPAGKTLDTLSIQGLFAGYTTGRLDTLTIKITNADGYLNKNAYGDSVVLIMKRTCPLNLADITGTMEVVSDGWGDYSPGDLVTLTQVDATTVSFMYPADNPQPILMKINPTTYAVTVTKQVYGSGYGGGGWPYSAISCQSVDGASSIVDPCEKTISVRLTHTVTQGSFGSFTIKFKKP
jgi:hypothetical protein